MPTKKVAAPAAVKAKKAPTKKAAAKVATKKASKAKHDLVCAPSEQCFWMTDGRVLANLVELRDALASMTDDVFAYHVTEERNDFADWVEQVLGDSELASSVRKTKKPAKAHDVVVTRLRIYSV